MKSNPIRREDFPIFSSEDLKRKGIIYLDHAATTQKPNQVIDVIKEYYLSQNANVHRGAHQLSAKATEAFENARLITADFISANSPKEIIFTRNATEAINLVARSWGSMELREGDEILLTLMEHHSNIVPWQLIAEEKGCTVKYVGIKKNGTLDINDFTKKLNRNTKIISLVHISNVLGCCNPIKEITDIAHNSNALVFVDACQSLAHHPIDVCDLKVDFLAGSSHKLCGPTGIGFLWGKQELLDKMPPFLGGGEMIEEVFLDHSSWAKLPHKFEAGTPAIGEAIGMGAALSYLQSIGLDKIQEYEMNITQYLFEKLEQIEGINLIGPHPKEQANRGALSAFTVEGLHSNDISTLLDSHGVCIRSGHHCCQPLHRHLGLTGSARVSLNFTSSFEEIDAFIDKLKLSIGFLVDNS